MMKKLAAFLTALVLVFSAGISALSEEDEEVVSYKLPIDFTPGNPINQKYYVSDTVYEDPTIRVEITSGSDERGRMYWIADIEIADASQLRTASADGFDSNGKEEGSVIARRMNAVLAIDGDFFNYGYNNPVHVTIRQGITFENNLRTRKCQDVLLIDEDGDFHGIEDPVAGDVGTEINGKKIINAFYFGPLLVNNGQKRGDEKKPSHMDVDQFSQRVALCQTGHLKYRVIVTSPNRNGTKAFKYYAWRDFVASFDDIQVAYNFDGGDSAFMFFNNRRVNDPDSSNERLLADIVYFASAWPGV